MNIGQNMAPLWLRKVQLSKFGEFHRILTFMLSPLGHIKVAEMKAYDPTNNQEYDVISACFIEDESLMKYSVKIYLCYTLGPEIKCRLYEIHWGGNVRNYEISIQGRDDIFFIESEIKSIKMAYLQQRENEINLLIEELQGSQGQFNFNQADNNILQEAIFDLISASAKFKALNFTRDE